MESDAFKIPLRPNPSTLPNVLPTILHEWSQAFKTNRKSFSFIPFQAGMSYLINTHHVPWGGWKLLHSRRGHRVILLFADSVELRADQRSGLSPDTCSFTVTVYHVHMSVSCSKRCWVITELDAVCIHTFALFDTWSTAWEQLGSAAASVIWIQTKI